MTTLRSTRISIVILALSGLALGASALQPATDAKPAQPAAPAQPGKPSVVRKNIAEPVDPTDANRYGSKTPAARVPGEIRIATYNLENLFDDKDDPKLKDKNEDKDMTKPRAQCEALGKAIHAVNPDILAVEEVESKEALIWFRDNWLKDMGYQYVSSIDAGDERGIEQGVLSRFPITKEQNWPKADLGEVGPPSSPMAGQPLQFHRSPLRVDIQVPSSAAGGKPYDVSLYVVHQKSGKDFGWFREIESKKIASLIKEEQTANPQANIIVLGDFNATANDESFKSYLTTGLIDIFKGFDSGRIPKYITHASGRAIDHILVSNTMVEEYDLDTRFVLSTPILPEGADFKLAKDFPGYASDHFPVSFDLKPADVVSGAAAPKAPEKATPKSDSKPAEKPAAK